MKVIQADLQNFDKGDCHKSLQEIVMRHEEILDFCNDLNHTFGPIIFQKFVAMAVAISVLGYQITMVC